MPFMPLIYVKGFTGFVIIFMLFHDNELKLANKGTVPGRFFHATPVEFMLLPARAQNVNSMNFDIETFQNTKLSFKNLKFIM